jgi:hypothetical protein
MNDFDDAQQEAILFPWIDTDEMSDKEDADHMEAMEEDDCSDDLGSGDHHELYLGVE